MAQQYAVIGLGAFGAAIARQLAGHGGDVIAVDKELEPVERVKDDVHYAVRLDATDPKVLEAHELHRADVAIVAIGSDFEAVVLISVELKQLGAKHIMARADTETQKKILCALGITDLISPEEEVARNVAQRLINPEIIDLFRLSDDYSIVEVSAPEGFWGQSLLALRVRERHQCNVIAIKRPQGEEEGGEALPEQLLIPLPDTELAEGDTLIVLGLAKDIEAMTA